MKLVLCTFVSSCLLCTVAAGKYSSPVPLEIRLENESLLNGPAFLQSDKLLYENLSTQGLKTDEAGPLSPGVSIGITLLITFISIFIVAGNIMVIMAVVIFRKLRRINNLLVVSLASADLIMGGVVLPLGCHYVVGSKWMLGNVACNVWTSIDILSVTASIETLCAISLDRFVAIFMPFRYSTKMTKNRARLIIIFIWVTSAAIAFIPINLGWWKTDEESDRACYDDPHCCEFRINKTYAVVSSLVSFYIPLIVMVFSYSIVFKIAVQQRSKICNREGVYRRASLPGKNKALLWGRGEYRAVFTMGIIMGTFVICWLPFFIVNIAQAFCNGCIDTNAFTLLNWLGYMNSFFNPIIYCHSIEFRRAFKRLLLCGLCREGYQQTSRASLSVSYTPSYSARSSLGNDSLFQFANFFLPRKGSAARRSSRLSTASTRPKPSPLINGFVPPNGVNRRSSSINNNNGCNGGYHVDRLRNNSSVGNGDSMELDLSSKYVPKPDQVFVTRRSCAELTNYRRAITRGTSSTHRPVCVPKKQRSMSVVPRDIPNNQLVFKTASYSDLANKPSKISRFLPGDNGACDDGSLSSSSIVTTVLDESNEPIGSKSSAVESEPDDENEHRDERDDSSDASSSLLHVEVDVYNVKD